MNSLLIKQNKNRIILLCYLLVLFLMELFFFRGALSSKGMMIGDHGDARLNNLIMEHWYNVFQSKESVRNLSEFYPVQNTISYTDMLLGYSIPYSFLRAIGINRFMACKIVLLCLHILGTYCLFFLLYKIFETTKYAAFLGTIAFSFANGYAIRMVHTQMMTLSLVPLLLIFISLAIKYYDSNKMRRIFLVLFASLYALIAYTGFYTFMFTTVFFMLFVVFEVVGLAVSDKDKLFLLWGRFKERIIDWILAVIFFAVLLIPFAKIYLPTQKLFGGRSWQNVLIMSPELIDIINVDWSNLLLGRFISKLNIGSTRTRWEWEMCEGFSIVLLLLLLIFYVKLFKEQFRKRILKENINLSDRILYLFGATSIFSVFLVIESGGYSLWYFIWKFVPGTSAIRAISRWYYFLLLPFGILLGLLSNKYFKFEKISIIKKVMFMAFIAFSLWISNVNKDTKCGWDYKNEITLLKTIPTPPKEAKIMALAPTESFFRNEEWLKKNLSCINLDSWMIADNFGLKTVNGYSGQFPLNWNIWDIFSDNYLKNLEDWIAANNIKDDVWLYDAVRREWNIQFKPLLYRIRVNTNSESELDGLTLYKGFYPSEKWGTWTKDCFSIKTDFCGSYDADKDLFITFTAHSYHIDHNVDVYVNDVFVDTVKIPQNDKLCFVKLDKNLLKNNENEFSFYIKEEIYRPIDVTTDNKDERFLGIGLINFCVAEK